MGRSCGLGVGVARARQCPWKQVIVEGQVRVVLAGLLAESESVGDEESRLAVTVSVYPGTASALSCLHLYLPLLVFRPPLASGRLAY